PRPEPARPALRAEHVRPRRPRFPDAAGPGHRPAGEASALHVHRPLAPVRGVDDEVQTLDRLTAEEAAARLVDGDVADAVAPEELRERGLVMIASVHGRRPRIRARL